MGNGDGILAREESRLRERREEQVWRRKT